MIKYTLLFIIFFGFVISSKAQNNLPVDFNKIDSIYNSFTLQQKIFSILIPKSIPDENHYHTLKSIDNENFEGFVVPRFIDMDSIFDFASEDSPLVSDQLIRSALLRGNNKELTTQFINLLIGVKGDGFFFHMKSPYSLLFRDKDFRPTDFFLEPYGRIALPYKSKQSNMACYMANLYAIPKNILANYPKRSLSNISTSQSAKYLSSLHWKELQNMLNKYETPSLESILEQGGLIYSENVKKDFDTLMRIFNSRVLSDFMLEQSCKNSLLIRELVKCHPEVGKYHSAHDEVNNIIRNLYRQGIVLLENKQCIPLNGLQNRNIASLYIGAKDESSFQKTLSKYAHIDHYNIESIPDQDELLKLKEKTGSYNIIIVGVNGDWYGGDKNKSLYSFLHQISSSAELILVHFGSGNRLVHLPQGHPFRAILLSYSTDNIAQEISAQIIFGGVGANGVLAKNINGKLLFGTGSFTSKSRLGYSFASEKVMADTLSLIDQIVYKAIRERATPGCQVLVAKDGDVIYSKSFGYHTYQKRKHVSNTDLYDIASVTKIVSSIPSIMKMYDEGRLNLSDSLSHLLPRLKGSNKSGLLIKDVLIHQAGLEAWIPFYIRAIDKEKLNGDMFSKKYSSSKYNIKLDDHLYLNKTVHYRSDIFRHGKSEEFSVRVSDKWYMNVHFIDSMRLGVDTSSVEIDPEYKYSDLGYYLIKDIIELTYGKTLDRFVADEFYRPLGANRMLYLPLSEYNKKEIVPTENDVAWRKELVHGYVHDPGAAMLGGVGGHAGVFSNAEDLVKILQMYNSYGSYGGEHYIDSTTIKLFTSVVKEGNRRGLGFDKPILDPEIFGSCSKEASPLSYGHSGFTGTLVWVDPEYDLIYIFLSNRIHPDQYNKKLISDDVRTRIQSAIYRSLPEYWEKKNKRPN